MDDNFVDIPPGFPSSLKYNHKPSAHSPSLTFSSTISLSSRSLLCPETKMLGKRMVSIKKLAKKVKGVGVGGDHDPDPVHHQCLLKEYAQESPTTIPTGHFPLYVGEERQRYVVPTTYLSHPLIKILLEKAYHEFGFEQTNGLVLPCSVVTFQEVLAAIQCNNGKFDLAKIFEDLI